MTDDEERGRKVTTHAEQQRRPMHRSTAKLNELPLITAFFGSVAVLAVCLSVVCANLLLLPLRVYLTGVATASVIDECSHVGIRHPVYTVRVKGSSDFIPTLECQPKDIGHPVTVIYSKIASKTVAVRGGPNLLKIYLALDIPAGPGLVLLLLLTCGLTLYRARTILRFGSTEIRSAWAPLTFAKGERGKSLVRASEVVTDFFFLGLIVVATGIIVYTLFRTTLYIQGATWFSLFAIGTLAIVWSPIPLKIIRFSWKTYKSSLFVIVRNLVACLLMLGSIRTIYKMPDTVEFNSLHGFFAFVFAVLKVSVGLDAK